MINLLGVYKYKTLKAVAEGYKGVQEMRLPLKNSQSSPRLKWTSCGMLHNVSLVLTQSRGTLNSSLARRKESLQQESSTWERDLLWINQ